ncbi:MAG: isochorismatase family protein [Bacteroides sp.]|nr:isochorismatase family protein [Bacteroides sp.]
METKRRMLMIIDPQIDFINGSLPVAGAQEAMDRLAVYIGDSDGRYVHKIVTADRHPYNHCSFKDCGGAWPRHCVHDTIGAAVWQPLFRPLYSTRGEVTFLYKGQHESAEEYSIFKNPESRVIIERIVESAGVDVIDLCGLAGDVCVLDTLRDGLQIFGREKFNVLTDFSPSLDGGRKLTDFLEGI